MTTSTATPPAKAGNKKLLWVIVALLVILVTMACAAGAWFFLKEDAPAAADTEAVHSVPAPVPVFVALKPFTVNLNDSSGRILYIGITLKAPGDEAAAALEAQMPEVRNRILMVLTAQQGDELTTSEGKQALAGALVGAFEKPFNGDEHGIAVSEALFTDFIVQ